MARENQINATFPDRIRERIERAVARYGKRDKAQVVLEIVQRYIDLYEQTEEAALAALTRQKAGGKVADDRERMRAAFNEIMECAGDPRQMEAVLRKYYPDLPEFDQTTPSRKLKKSLSRA